MVLIALCLLLAGLVLGCSNNTESTSTPGVTPSPVTLKVFNNLPDRSTGMGMIDQQIIDAYMKDNPHVKIEVESLTDEPYKNKVKVYSSSKEMPDVLMSWGLNSFIDPLINGGLLADLNADDFKDFNFLPGSLEAFSRDGKLYGIPKNNDFMVVYYNKKIFADNGIEVPKTLDELTQVVIKLREKNIQPISVNGMDGWIFELLYEHLAQRMNGDFSQLRDAVLGKSDFTDNSSLLEAAEKMLQMSKEGTFQDGYLTADYGAARNAFVNGETAMYYMGSWEMNLQSDQNLTQEFRDNVSLFPFPAGEKGQLEDILGWYGGGYAVGNTGSNKDEALKFLKFYFKSENYAKMGWQTGSVLPAQKYDEYLTGNETQIQNDLTAVINSAKNTSGSVAIDSVSDELKNGSYQLFQELLSEQKTPTEFLQDLEDLAASARENQK
jgi:raffinose/stachyose/melibiose transport system substrate-binding protein